MGKISLNDLQYLKTFTVASNVIQEAYKRTKTVLDIEMSNQNGLTIRTLEVLGSNLKLITTNKNVVNELFFDTRRVFVLDRKNIFLEPSFFIHTIEFNTEIEKYHIDNWLTHILSKATA
jgi:spore maturation protein CgeB